MRIAMTQPADIGWVEPEKPIRGLDHLGVQAPSIALYTQLLPGITNVTNRARYYSFHPWLIRSFEITIGTLLNRQVLPPRSVATMLPRPGSTRGDSRRLEGTTAWLERDDRQRLIARSPLPSLT